MASFKKAMETLKIAGEAKKDARAAKDPRYAKVLGIEREALRRSKLPDSPGGAKSTHQERYDIRAGLREEAGFDAEKKKRGGIAGVWDRNKKIIKPIATVGAGLLTGGMALPAMIGAGIGGLDREGKGGIGFDVGGAVKGGLKGAAAGYGGKLLGSAITGARGAMGAGLNPLWGAGEMLKSSGAGKLIGSAVSAGKGMLGDAVTNPDGSLDGKGILKGAMGAIPLLQGMKAQREANERSSATAGQADASNDAILELAKMLMMRSGGAGGGGKPDLSFLRDRQNPYAGQFQPSLAPPRM